jgi:hypothetical protein
MSRKEEERGEIDDQSARKNDVGGRDGVEDDTSTFAFISRLFFYRTNNIMHHLLFNKMTLPPCKAIRCNAQSMYVCVCADTLPTLL